MHILITINPMHIDEFNDMLEDLRITLNHGSSINSWHMCDLTEWFEEIPNHVLGEIELIIRTDNKADTYEEIAGTVHAYQPNAQVKIL